MVEPRQAFLRISEIVSIVEVAEENVVVRLKDGREFSVLAKGAYECWTNIMDVVDPQSDDGPMPPSRDPFIQFSLRPN
jgi:hypothetical protein